MNDLMQAEFGTVAEAIHQHAVHSPTRRALVEATGERTRALTYAQLDTLMDQVAAALQRDGLQPGHAIAICASTSIEYAAVFLGALRAGVVVAPLAPSSTPASLARMLADADARLVFTDVACAGLLGEAPSSITRIALDGSAAGMALNHWLAASKAAESPAMAVGAAQARSEEHTSELQSR